MVGSLNVEGRLYALILVFLYRVLEHLQILVYEGCGGLSWNQSPMDTEGQLSFWGVKSCTQTFVQEVGFFNGQRYIHAVEYYSAIKMIEVLIL